MNNLETANMSRLPPTYRPRIAEMLQAKLDQIGKNDVLNKGRPTLYQVETVESDPQLLVPPVAPAPNVVPAATPVEQPLQIPKISPALMRASDVFQPKIDVSAPVLSQVLELAATCVPIALSEAEVA